MHRLYLTLLLPVLLIAPPLAIARYLWCILFNPEKAWRIAIGFDQLANVATNGTEDETISSRANRARANNRRWGCVLCQFLDIFDKNHCQKSAGI